MRSDIRTKLYDFRTGLSPELEDVAAIVTEHIKYTDNYSEKEIFESLNNRLQKYTYANGVNVFLESIDNQLSDQPLLYALKDIYYKLSRQQDRFLYEPIIKTVLECINVRTEDERRDKIINDLRIYDWVNEVNGLIYNITENPQIKHNMTSVGGIVEDIYSVLIDTENGYLTYIDENWYLLNDEGIKETLLEYHIEDVKTLQRMRKLEEAVNVAVFDETGITFRIAEGLDLKLDTVNNKVFLNKDEKEVETTLETLFNSPIIPLESKSFYPVINETFTNMDKFANISAAKKVWNPLNKMYETIVFNFEGKFYQKRKNHNSTSFLQYKTALPLIENVKKELGADIQFLFEDSLEEELKAKLKLENQVKVVSKKIEKIEESILLIKDEEELLNTEDKIKTLYETLLVEKQKLNEKLNSYKNKLFEINNEMEDYEDEDEDEDTKNNTTTKTVEYIVEPQTQALNIPVVSGRSEPFSCPLPDARCDRHKIDDEEGRWEFCNTCKREWAR